MRADMALREKMNRLCRETGLSVYELAYRVGMPPSTVKNIIYGKSRNPGLNTIHKICCGFGMSLGEFFSDALFENLEEE